MNHVLMVLIKKRTFGDRGIRCNRQKISSLLGPSGMTDQLGEVIWDHVCVCVCVGP